MTAEYPTIEKLNQGYKVHLSPGSSLPGIYTSVFLAEKAIARYAGSMAEAKQKRKQK